MSTPAEDRGPQVAVFPPVLFVGTLLAGLALQWAWPLRLWPAWMPRSIVGTLLVVSGLALARWGERTMHGAGTEVRPDRPSTAIVDGGPFRYSRNPLYLGVNLVLLGAAMIVNTGWILLLLIPMDLVLHFGVVRREERYLERKFGATYGAYRDRVGRYF